MNTLLTIDDLAARWGRRREDAVRIVREGGVPYLPLPARELPPCEAAEANDDVAALGRTLPCLKDQHRIVLEQRYFHGRTFDEIAAEIGITKQGAHVAHAHAIAALRRALDTPGHVARVDRPGA